MSPTSDNPNVNCLQGMSCPSCQSFGPFRIEVTQSGPVRVSDDGTDFIEGNIEWDDGAQCECCGCGAKATVAEFRGEPAPALDALQRQVVEGYQNGEFSTLAPAEIATCGDGLLRFLLSELSHAEDCDSTETAVNRLNTAIRDLEELRDFFEQRA